MEERRDCADLGRHVVVHAVTHPGSQDLRAVFDGPKSNAVPRCNDTSIGVGHFPRSRLETLVFEFEEGINGRQRACDNPAWGEDIKVMGARRGRAVTITVACAMVDRFVRDVDDYAEQKELLKAFVRGVASSQGVHDDLMVCLNPADDLEQGCLLDRDRDVR